MKKKLLYSIILGCFGNPGQMAIDSGMTFSIIDLYITWMEIMEFKGSFNCPINILVKQANNKIFGPHLSFDAMLSDPGV